MKVHWRDHMTTIDVPNKTMARTCGGAARIRPQGWAESLLVTRHRGHRELAGDEAGKRQRDRPKSSKDSGNTEGEARASPEKHERGLPPGTSKKQKERAAQAKAAQESQTASPTEVDATPRTSRHNPGF